MSRKRPGTDTPGYQGMMRRLVRRAGERAHTDLAALAALAEIQTRVDAEMRAAARALNEAGCSWDEIGHALGKPRQNVWRKYGRPDDTAPGTPAPDRPAGHDSIFGDPAVRVAIREHINGL